MNEEAALHAILRKDPHAFILKTFETLNPGTVFLHNWHIEAVAWHLQQCVTGATKRLIITLPPRHLKSMCASVALPIWILGRDPTREIICVSYSDDLARHFSIQRRRCIEAPWCRSVFPSFQASPLKNTENEFANSMGGSIFTTSIGGTLTGRGANFIIIDDPMKADAVTSEAERNSVNAWYRNTLYTRLNNKNEDVIIIVMQRIHMDDLVGHVLDLDDWEILNLPAISTEDAKIPLGDNKYHCRHTDDVLHPEREDINALRKAKKTLGSYLFEAQYQQNPVPPGGNLIKRDWFRRYDRVPPLETFEKIDQCWDTATGSEPEHSYSVCTTWGQYKNSYYLLDVLRQRLEFPDLVRAVKRKMADYQANAILIEKAASGHALLQVLGSNTNLPTISIPPPTGQRNKSCGGITDDRSGPGLSAKRCKLAR